MPASWSKLAVLVASTTTDSASAVSLRAASPFAVRSPHPLLPTSLVDIGAGVLDGDAEGGSRLSAAVATARAASVAAQAAERNAEVAAKEALTAETRKKQATQLLQQDMDVSSYLGDDTCDVTSSGGPVCFAGQQAALLPPAVLPGLVGRYTFDEAAALDSSGYGHHAGADYEHAPAPGGLGHSAKFTKSFVTIPNSKELELKDFTYTFWVFRPEEEGSDPFDDTAQWCPLIRKGVHVATAREFANSPALFLSPSSGQLRLATTTETTQKKSDGEFVDSNARVLPNRWVHVAAVHHSSKLMLYVNGILDSVTVLKSPIMPNKNPLYVGGDPFTTEMCGHTIYMDELRVHNHAITPHELQAEAAPALGGADPSFVHFGCSKCSLMEAAKSCPASRHICSSLELHTGAYQVARNLGWIRAGSHVWTSAALEQAEKDPLGQTTGHGGPAVGLGLCCDGEVAHT